MTKYLIEETQWEEDLFGWKGLVGFMLAEVCVGDSLHLHEKEAESREGGVSTLSCSSPPPATQSFLRDERKLGGGGARL